MMITTSAKANFNLQATCGNKNAETLKPLSRQKRLQGDSGTISITYPMGDQPLLWDEFHPNLYNMQSVCRANNESDEKDIAFGMREFTTAEHAVYYQWPT